MNTFARALSVVGLLAATVLAPTAAAEPTCDPMNQGSSPDSCAGKPPQTWPAAQGNFTSPTDPGWVYFKPFFAPAGYTGPKADSMRAHLFGCGIGPDGTIGCDATPAMLPDGTAVQEGMPGPPGFYSCGGRRCPLPGPGTNQTVAGPQEPAQYVKSDTLTFTRDVDVLPEGYRLVNGAAWCAVGYQGSVTCSSGANGFTFTSTGGVLEGPSQP